MAIDKYLFVRDAYLQRRRKQVKPPDGSSDVQPASADLSSPETPPRQAEPTAVHHFIPAGQGELAAAPPP